MGEGVAIMESRFASAHKENRMSIVSIERKPHKRTHVVRQTTVNKILKAFDNLEKILLLNNSVGFSDEVRQLRAIGYRIMGKITTGTHINKFSD